MGNALSLSLLRSVFGWKVVCAAPCAEKKIANMNPSRIRVIGLLHTSLTAERNALGVLNRQVCTAAAPAVQFPRVVVAPNRRKLPRTTIQHETSAL
jgi:hypothetical protein